MVVRCVERGTAGIFEGGRIRVFEGLVDFWAFFSVVIMHLHHLH